MSRLPGLQFPSAGNQQPLTRRQQRPGPNLLQQLFRAKKDKLDRRGQDFQEESFNAAKSLYEGSLDQYEADKAAHDQQQQQGYDAAEQSYNTALSEYNTAKNAYDQQLAQHSQESQAQATLQPYFEYRDAPGIIHNADDTYTVQDPHIAGGAVHFINPGDPRHQAISGTPPSTIAPVTTPLPETFNVAPPTFDYQRVAFGSEVPSFNYVAPESPGARNSSKLGTLAQLAAQLQEAQPNQRGRGTTSPTSFYSMF